MVNSEKYDLNVKTDAVGRRLRAIRERYGFSGHDLAARIGCGQARISKIECGKLKPSVEFVRSFANALALPTAEAQDLELFTELFLLEFDRWHLSRAGSAMAIQRGNADLDRSAKYTRSLSWFVLSGLLQTKAYATHLFKSFHELSTQDANKVIDQRLERQRHLQARKKRFHFVIGEHVLYFNICPKDVMLEQIKQLSIVARMTNVDLRIVQSFVPLAAIPCSNFDIIDNRLVTVETRDFQEMVWEPDKVAGYLSDFDLLSRCSTSSLESTLATLALIQNRVSCHWT